MTHLHIQKPLFALFLWSLIFKQTTVATVAIYRSVQEGNVYF